MQGWLVPSLTDKGKALAAVGRAASVRVVRKDCLVARLQGHEARAAGAGGVLLILGMLGPSALGACLAAARSHRMFVLLEAFDAAELQRAGGLLGLFVGKGGPGVGQDPFPPGIEAAGGADNWNPPLPAFFTAYVASSARARRSLNSSP